jgi:hypothetical protein
MRTKRFIEITRLFIQDSAWMSDYARQAGTMG